MSIPPRDTDESPTPRPAVVVNRAQVRAAQLRVRSDIARGITPDPRMVKIANAKRGKQ